MNTDYETQVTNAYKDFKSNKDISGFQSIIDFINSGNPTLVIDAGCANNIFKYYIQNLQGFDVRDIKEADYKGTYQDMDKVFKPNSADAIICFGSLGFGNKQIIQSNLELMYKWLTKTGYLFMIEISDHDVTEKDVKDYPQKYFWNKQKIEYFQNKFNFKVSGNPVLHLGKLNWVWQK